MLLRSTKFSLVFALLFAVAATAALVSVWLLVNKEGDELEQTVTVIEDSSAKAQEFSRLSAVLEASIEDREELHMYLLDENDIISFIADLEQAGRGFGLEFETESLNVVETNGALDTLEVSFSMVGQYEGNLRFVQLLETLPYQSRITGYTLERELSSERYRSRVGIAVSLITYE